MKKGLLALSMAALLVITGCGGGGDNTTVNTSDTTVTNSDSSTGLPVINEEEAYELLGSAISELGINYTASSLALGETDPLIYQVTIGGTFSQGLLEAEEQYVGLIAHDGGFYWYELNDAGQAEFLNDPEEKVASLAEYIGMFTLSGLFDVEQFEVLPTMKDDCYVFETADEAIVDMVSLFAGWAVEDIGIVQFVVDQEGALAVEVLNVTGIVLSEVVFTEVGTTAIEAYLGVNVVAPLTFDEVMAQFYLKNYREVNQGFGFETLYTEDGMMTYDADTEHYLGLAEINGGVYWYELDSEGQEVPDTYEEIAAPEEGVNFYDYYINPQLLAEICDGGWFSEFYDEEVGVTYQRLDFDGLIAEGQNEETVENMRRWMYGIFSLNDEVCYAMVMDIEFDKRTGEVTVWLEFEYTPDGSVEWLAVTYTDFGTVENPMLRAFVESKTIAE